MKTLFLLTTLLITSFSKAQTSPIIPSKIDLKFRKIKVEPLCFLGENHYVFSEVLDSLAYESCNQFKIQKLDATHFSIAWVMASDRKFKDTCGLTLIAYRKKRSWGFDVPVKLFCPVKIKFTDQETGKEIDLKQDTIKGVKSFVCKAVWDTPAYHKTSQRFRGHFQVTVKSPKGDALLSQSGWYDSGDATRPFDLPPFAGMNYLQIELNQSNLKTLLGDYYLEDRSKGGVKLSEDMPAVLIFGVGK